MNLALNEVTEAGADSVAAFLQGRTALQRLVLRENELGDDGALALAHALQVPVGLMFVMPGFASQLVLAPHNMTASTTALMPVEGRSRQHPAG